MSNDLYLFKPLQLGPYRLPHRVIMAPLTRMRTAAGNVPTELNALYYSQRVSAALIIAEATQVAPEGHGYAGTPGIHSPEQIEGWKRVTSAVHDTGGRIFLQLWHAGRVSHPSLQPGGKLPVAPSALNLEGMAVTPSGLQPFVTPRALLTEEIPLIIEQFRQGARNAMLAGFDGVELHAANGYLIDQFLQDGSNHRTDQYGGSIENRARLLLETTEAVVDVWGADRVGVRLSPSSAFNSMHDSNPQALFGYVASALDRMGLAFLHIVEPRIDGNVTVEREEGLGAKHFRSLFKRVIMTAGGYTRETAEAALVNGDADLVAFGRLFISNPDLPRRLALGAPLAPYDRSTFYGGDARGYIDYPALAA